MRTLARILVNAFALWLTTLIVGGVGDQGVWVTPVTDGNIGQILTYIIVALIFGLVNGTLGKVVRVISIPLYIITLGLFSLIVNGIMIAVVVWLSDLAGFGLHVDGFWWGVLAALVLAILSGILNALLGTSRKRDRR